MNRMILSAVGCLLIACRAGGGEDSDRTRVREVALPAATRTELSTEEQKTLYALGLMLGRNLSSFQLKPEQLAFVMAGLDEQMSGKPPRVDLSSYASKLSELARSGQTAAVKIERDRGKAYADQAAKEPGAQVTSSGLIYIPLEEGNGASPAATDVVRVEYQGALIDGSVFDSSVGHQQPVALALDRMVPCWSEGLQKMKVGGRAKLVCPSSLGYGELARPKIPAGSTLVFHIQLASIDPAKR